MALGGRVNSGYATPTPWTETVNNDSNPTLQYARGQGQWEHSFRRLLLWFGWLSIVVGTIQAGALIHEMSSNVFPVFGWKPGSRFWASANLVAKYNYGSLGFALSAIAGGLVLVIPSWSRSRLIAFAYGATHLTLGVVVLGFALAMVAEIGKV